MTEKTKAWILILSVVGFIFGASAASIETVPEFHPELTQVMQAAGNDSVLVQAEILRQLYLWIPYAIRYDIESVLNDSRNHDWSAESVLANGRGTCLGWSLVFQKYAREYGIDCDIVVDSSRMHVYNSVVLAGNVYTVDVTAGSVWWDESEYKLQRVTNFRYFMY